MMIIAIEIVDLPINSMVIFHSYVNVYQRVYLIMHHGYGSHDIMGLFMGIEIHGKFPICSYVFAKLL